MNWNGLLDQWRKKYGERIKLPRKRGVLFLWAAATVVALLFCSVAWAKKTVVLVVDGKDAAVKTLSRTVEGALKKQNVALLEKDEVIPSLSTPLKRGMVITVNRAVDVKIAVDGNEIPARTRGLTVKDLLAEYNINLGSEDEVTPSKDTRIVQDLKVSIIRVATKTEIKDVPIEYETRKQYTTRLQEGTTRVAREGKEGTERQTWQITLRDGQEVSRQLASREVVTPAVDRIIMVGSGMVVSRGGENIRYSDIIDMVASAYTYTGYNTASGVPPHYGIAAVDTGKIPIGTRLYVEGYGYATALDRGSAIKGNRIDLFFESYDEAMSWGVRRVKVYILD